LYVLLLGSCQTIWRCGELMLRRTGHVTHMRPIMT